MKNKVTRGIAIVVAIVVATLLFGSNAMSFFTKSVDTTNLQIGDPSKADLEYLDAPRD